MLAGVCAYRFFFILQETHLPTLVARTRDSTNGTKLQRPRAKYIPQNAKYGQPMHKTLSRAILLPLQLKCRHTTIAAILILMLVFQWHSERHPVVARICILRELSLFPDHSRIIIFGHGIWRYHCVGNGQPYLRLLRTPS